MHYFWYYVLSLFGVMFYQCPFQEMLEALKALSVFFTENSLRTRRNLRGDIERRSLAINEEFAQIFKEVKEVTEFCKKMCYKLNMYFLK